MLQGSAVGVSGSEGLQMTTGHGVITAPGLIYAFGHQCSWVGYDKQAGSEWLKYLNYV